jgi:hypothetical protein
MRYADYILWFLFIGAIILLLYAARSSQRVERFIDAGSIAGLNLTDMSTQALDAAPSTSEAKQHYKTLLVFANTDIRRKGTDALRILADFRDRIYTKRNFRADLTYEDVLADYPEWMPPLDPTIAEPVPSVEDAINAEARLLAYLQKNFPQEDLRDDQTQSVVKGLLDDFAYRFVFERGLEEKQLRGDLLSVPLLKDWKNPVMAKRGVS